MKKLFTHENRMIVYNMKNLLQSERVLTPLLRNEFSRRWCRRPVPAFRRLARTLVAGWIQTSTRGACLILQACGRRSSDDDTLGLQRLWRKQ